MPAAAVYLLLQQCAYFECFLAIWVLGIFVIWYWVHGQDGAGSQHGTVPRASQRCCHLKVRHTFLHPALMSMQQGYTWVHCTTVTSCKHMVAQQCAIQCGSYCAWFGLNCKHNGCKLQQCSTAMTYTGSLLGFHATASTMSAAAAMQCRHYTYRQIAGIS